MVRCMRMLASALGLLAGIATASSALAQKAGGTLTTTKKEAPAVEA